MVEGKAMPDHVHMLLSLPPRYSIAMTVGYLNGKSAIRIHRDLSRIKGTLFGRSFWARGYFVSTVGSMIFVLPLVVEWGFLKSPCSQGEGSLNKAGAIR